MSKITSGLRTARECDMELTQETFDLLPIGQLLVEASGSGRIFIKARKVSLFLIEMIVVDACDFSASYRKKVFDPSFDNLTPVDAFVDARGTVNTFEELRKIFEC